MSFQGTLYHSLQWFLINIVVVAVVDDDDDDDNDYDDYDDNQYVETVWKSRYNL